MKNELKKLRPNRLLAVLLCAVLLPGLFPQASLPAAAADEKKDPKDLVVVSLGDSYSAGEGIDDFYNADLPLKQKVEDPDWLAHRSENSWPGKIKIKGIDGQLRDHRNENWYFAAASGAVTADLNGRQKKEYYKYTDKKKKEKAEVLDDYKYLDAQLDVFDQVKKDGKTVDYVTITMGGNDAHFSEIVTLAADPRERLKDFNCLSKKLNETWQEFYEPETGIRARLYQAYHDIENKAGADAKIIVVGYPKLLEQNGKGLLFTKYESQLIDDSVTRFNKELRAIVNECKSEGMKICFVSIEEEFNGYEAYSGKDAMINEVITSAKEQDLKDKGASAYSMHPNEKGAEKIADLVSEKIKGIEADGGRSEWPDFFSSDERDVVLVLDVSGSMDGEPIEQTKIASDSFIDTVLGVEASVGIVTYDESAMKVAGFNRNERYLKGVVENLNSGGGTNIESGLTLAYSMLSGSHAKKKIIVLMSDGEPNHGAEGDALVSVADEIKNDGVYIYTLGFFSSSGYGEAQRLMERLASEGKHYEVDDAEQLRFFFGDIADQISGEKLIYIRIECPVDVRVSYGGETLSSKDHQTAQRTSFGSLTFEENTEEGSENAEDDRVKILRLKEGAAYDISIFGNGKGKMNYTIGFMDEDGEYGDLRRFTNIPINKRTEIETTAANEKTTTLKVDTDGDGKFDKTYRAEENGRGKLVDNSWILYVVIAAAGVIALLVVFFVLRSKLKNRKRRLAAKKTAAPAPKSAAPIVKHSGSGSPLPGLWPEKKAAPQQPKNPPAKEIPEAFRFCKHCGCKLKAGAAFCPQCGKQAE